MAVTITNNLTNLELCDSTTNFSLLGGASGLTADSETFQTGSASIGAKLSNNAGGIQYDLPASRNMTGEHVFIWARANVPIDPAGTGIRIFLGDGTNTNEYIVFTSATYPDGWVRLVLECDRVPDVDNSANISAITAIAVEFDTAQTVKGAIPTVWIDRIDVQPSSTAYAIDVSGGTTGARGTWAEIIADTTANDTLGIVQRKFGIVAVNAPISFGITTASDSYFEDSDEVIVFQDQPVEDDYFGLEFKGNSGQTNHFRLGSEVGTGDDSRGTGGGIIKSAGASFHIKATDANMNPLDFFGVTIDGAGKTQWEQTNAQAVSCVWTNSGQITHHNNAEMREGTISASTEVLATHTGTADLDFNDNGASPDTIVRPAGSWITDGFEVGDEVVVTGTTSNNISMVITALTATVLSVATGTITDEQNTSGKVEAKGSGAIQFLQNPVTPDFRDMSIINCVHAIEWDQDGATTMDLRGVSFAGNTFDYRFNHESGLHTVNVLEGSDTPTTSDGGAGGTISVVSSQPITITVLEAEDFVTAIVGARVGVHRQDNNAELLNTTTNVSGVASGTTSYTGAVFIRVRDEDENYVKIPATIVAGTGLVQTIALANDDIYAAT